jgi:hypothetical protein
MGNKKTSTPNTNIESKPLTTKDREAISLWILKAKQDKAQSWIGKWYWQIRIDREIKRKTTPLYIDGAEGDEDNF